MHFDFEDYRPDTPRLDSAISTREGVLLSIVFHAVAIAVVVFVIPRLDRLTEAARLAAVQRAEQRALAQQEQARRDQRRFVFVQPRVDLEALRAPERSEDSDKNRIARAPERAGNPANPLPFSRGNSPERVDTPDVIARAQAVPETLPSPPGQARDAETAERDGAANDRQSGANLPDNRNGPRLATQSVRNSVSNSALSEALRNLWRYVDREAFDNPQGGGGQYGPSIQFDTKGVEFGPWIRRFVAQVKHNWIVPYAAFAMQGHVVITFFVHKDGALLEIHIEEPSSIDGFTHAAYNALATSNPTYPLPPEYPSDRAFFTVTFYYNETPPAQ